MAVSTTSGDFDGDGAVSGSDFLTWQRGLGKAGASFADGDADGDGAVTANDLGAWRDAFGGGVEASGEGLSASTYWLAFEEEVADELIDSVFEEPMAESVRSALKSPVAVESRKRPAVEPTQCLVEQEQADVAFEELADDPLGWDDQ
jgi:hypothetical protein